MVQLLSFLFFCCFRTKMKSIRKFLIQEFEKNQSKVSVLHKSPEQLQAEWDECFAKNEAWNAEIVPVRAARLQKEAEARREYVLEKLAGKEQRKQEMRESISETVLQQKTQVGGFITAENIDQAIEFALANPTDHNYAIDLEGNMYKGRESDQPVPLKQSQIQS